MSNNNVHMFVESPPKVAVSRFCYKGKKMFLNKNSTGPSYFKKNQTAMKELLKLK